MRRGLLLLLSLLLLASPALAKDRTIALVLDRSASLSAADPDGRGPRLLAQTLGLLLAPGDRLTILASGGTDLPAQALGSDPAVLAPLFTALLAATPQPGGADLTATLVAACRRAGKDGLVIVYTDDDLDVVRPDGTAPPAALAQARRDQPRPTRTQVNAAARALLVSALEAVTPRPTILGLRAPLPPRARATPLLSAIGARVIELGAADDLPAADQLATSLSGDPRVSRVVITKPSQSSLALPYPARVAISSPRPITVAGGTALDGPGRRLWLVETTGDVTLPTGAALRCAVMPTATIPDGVLAYRLRRGVVRIVAPGAPAQALVLRAGGSDRPLVGDPPQVSIQTGGADDDAAPILLRIVREGKRQVVTDRRALTLTDARVILTASGDARVGQTLTLSGQLPPGLTVKSLPILIKETSGAGRRIELSVEGRTLTGSVLCQSAGSLTVASDGAIEVGLKAPVTVGAAATNAIVIKALTSNGKPLEANPVRLDGDGKATINLTLAIEPAPPSPVQVDVVLAGAPAGATLSPAGPLTIADSLTVELTLTWPVEAPGALVGFTIDATKGGATPANVTFEVRPPTSPLKKILAGVFLVLALIWGFLIYRWRRKEEVFLADQIAKKQLRTLGTNGRISPERYLLRDYFETSDQGVIVQPDESPGGEMVFRVRPDGNVDVEARDGAKLVHSDRPTVLADKVILAHGTAFAMVHKNRALRYVYLQDEPSGEELSQRWLGDGVSYEPEMRDSGVFVLLEEDQNLPKMSARLEASAETLFPVSDMIEDSGDEVAVVPSDPGREIPVSDEGIVIMDSAEGRIMESDDLEFLARSTDLGKKITGLGGDAAVDADEAVESISTEFISMDDLNLSDSAPPADHDEEDPLP